MLWSTATGPTGNGTAGPALRGCTASTRLLDVLARLSLAVPILVWRPSVTRGALRLGPLAVASRTHPAGGERVPRVPAPIAATLPGEPRPGREAAERAANAVARVLALCFASDGGLGPGISTCGGLTHACHLGRVGYAVCRSRPRGPEPLPARAGRGRAAVPPGRALRPGHVRPLRRPPAVLDCPARHGPALRRARLAARGPGH